MTAETYIKALLAGYAYKEGFASGGRDTMLAIACVIRNRVRRGWNAGDWVANINTAPDVAPFGPVELWWNVNDANFRHVLGEVDDIFTGTFDDSLTAGGLYYMDASLLQSGRVISPWFEQRIVRDSANHPRIAQVGSLLIFA